MRPGVAMRNVYPAALAGQGDSGVSTSHSAKTGAVARRVCDLVRRSGRLFQRAARFLVLPDALLHRVELAVGHRGQPFLELKELGLVPVVQSGERVLVCYAVSPGG